MAASMQHWNGHQLCAIDIETSGLDPYWNEIIQLCILPLDSNIEPRRDVMPFNIYLTPSNPGTVNVESLKINKINLETINRFGHDQEKAKDMFDHWVTKLKLPVTPYGQRKRIIPLAHGWQFDSAFIKRWLGYEKFGEVFDSRYVDTMVVGAFMNDRAGMRAEKVPFSKLNLAWLSKELKLDREPTHDALQDCLATAEVYRRLLQSGVMA